TRDALFGPRTGKCETCDIGMVGYHNGGGAAVVFPALFPRIGTTRYRDDTTSIAPWIRDRYKVFLPRSSIEPSINTPRPAVIPSRGVYSGLMTVCCEREARDV